MEKLKPCPWCGGKGEYRYIPPYNVVKCRKCKSFGLPFVDEYEQQDGKEKAIEAWNRRVFE